MGVILALDEVLGYYGMLGFWSRRYNGVLAVAGFPAQLDLIGERADGLVA